MNPPFLPPLMPTVNSAFNSGHHSALTSVSASASASGSALAYTQASAFGPATATASITTATLTMAPRREAIAGLGLTAATTTTTRSALPSTLNQVPTWVPNGNTISVPTTGMSVASPLRVASFPSLAFGGLLDSPNIPHDLSLKPSDDGNMQRGLKRFTTESFFEDQEPRKSAFTHYTRDKSEAKDS